MENEHTNGGNAEPTIAVTIGRDHAEAVVEALADTADDDLEHLVTLLREAMAEAPEGVTGEHEQQMA